jgi:peroxiredoxin Q/BCP
VDFADRQEEGALPEIRIGDSPPDFRLPAPGNKGFGLSDFRGRRHVVLAFYPFDWSPG